MAKYHVKKDGTPGICRAQDGNCPLGDTNEHFSNVQDAQEYADKLNEQRPKRDAIGRDYIANSYWYGEVYKIMGEVFDSFPPLKTGEPSVKCNVFDEGVTVTDKGIKVNLETQVAVGRLDSKYPDYAKTDVNIYFDLDNIDNIKFEVDSRKKSNFVGTTLGHDIRELNNNEEEILRNYETKIKNKLTRRKSQIKGAVFEDTIYGDGNNYIYNDLNKFNGKTFKEASDIVAEDLYYIISSKDKVIAEGHRSYGDFDENILNSKIKGMDVLNAGSAEEEMVKFYI